MADADTQTEQRAGRISKGKFCWAEAVTHPPWQHMREPSFFSLLTSFCNVLQSPEFRNRANIGSVLELWWLIWHISGREQAPVSHKNGKWDDYCGLGNRSASATSAARSPIVLSFVFIVAPLFSDWSCDAPSSAVFVVQQGLPVLHKLEAVTVHRVNMRVSSVGIIRVT